jgi:hypothetical protein
MGRTNFFLSTMPFSPWAASATWSSEKYRKNELNTRFQQTNLPRAHVESELDVLGVHRKLVKYVVHSSKRKKIKKIFFFTQAAQIAINQFLVSRNFRN